MNMIRITLADIRENVSREDMKSIEKLIADSYFRGDPEETILDPVREVGVRSLLDIYKIGMDTLIIDETDMKECERFYNAAEGCWKIIQGMIGRINAPMSSETISSAKLFCGDVISVCDDAMSRIQNGIPPANQ